MITLYPYCPPTFLTAAGSSRKARQLVRKGFPENLRNWRFLTLTVNRENYADEKDAFEKGSRHVREFLYRLRKVHSFSRWFWKLEFHAADEDGRQFAHWHVLVDYKRLIPAALLGRLWGKGRTNIKVVRDSGLKYVFKYVCKALDDVPQWVSEMSRIRLYQASKGFFSRGDGVAKAKEPSPRHAVETTDSDTQNEASRLRAETIGERMKRWSRSVITRSESDCGQFKRHRVHVLSRGCTWATLLHATARGMLGANMSPKNVKIDSSKIEVTCLNQLPLSQFLYQLAHT